MVSSGGIEIEYKGAQKYLKAQGNKRNKSIEIDIKRIVGQAVGVMKQSVPVLKGFLKGSIFSKDEGNLSYTINASVAYAVKRNYVNNLNPDRKGYIQKTCRYIQQRLARIK